MTRLLLLAAYALAAAAPVGCGTRPAPADTGAGGGGGAGPGGTADCRLAGTWVGTPAVVEADGVRLTPEMQAQIQAAMPPMEFTFTRAGGVTFTAGGRAMTYAKAGDVAVGGDPFSGVASVYEVKSLTAAADRVEVQLLNRSGASGLDHRDPAARDDSQLSTWTFTLAGDRVEMRCVGATRSNLTGRQSSVVMAATLSRAGAGEDGGAAPGGGAVPAGRDDGEGLR